jgi:type I restriction enzyme S subunit
MRGAANVSLSISNIKTVEIIVPPIEKQVEIIELEKKVRTQRQKLDEKNIDQNNYLANLRQQILQDAILGKLTAGWRAKNPDIEPASKLLEKIKAEKEKLIAEKKIKKEKPLPEIEEDEMPFELPEKWEWCHLGEICTIQTGKKDANQGSENGKYNFYTCAQEPIKSDEYSFEGESILLPGNGANVGFVNFVNEKFEAYQRTYVLNNFLLVWPEYIAKVLEGLWKKNLGAQYGSAINYIKLGNITDFKCPIPPLAEQKAIVAKVEKLMEHVSKLEEKIKQNKQDAEMLMQSFLVEAFKN